jgi:hypothetical protein
VPENAVTLAGTDVPDAASTRGALSESPSYTRTKSYAHSVEKDRNPRTTSEPDVAVAELWRASERVVCVCVCVCVCVSVCVCLCV